MRERTKARALPGAGSRSNSGITLLETAIAIAVLTIGLLGASSAVVSTVKLSKEARDAQVAAQQLQTVVEWIQGTPYSSLTTTFPKGVLTSPSIVKRLPNEQIDISYFSYDISGNEVALPSPAPTPFPSQLQYRLRITWQRSVDGKTTPLAQVPAVQTVTGVRTASE